MLNRQQSHKAPPIGLVSVAQLKMSTSHFQLA